MVNKNGSECIKTTLYDLTVFNYEHSDTSAMCKLCREKDKVTITDSKEIGVINESLITQQTFSKNTPNVVLISESGLYRILAKCNLPKCEPFESWVFDEVLPSIRKIASV